MAVLGMVSTGKLFRSFQAQAALQQNADAKIQEQLRNRLQEASSETRAYRTANEPPCHFAL